MRKLIKKELNKQYNKNKQEPISKVTSVLQKKPYPILAHYKEARRYSLVVNHLPSILGRKVIADPLHIPNCFYDQS